MGSEMCIRDSLYTLNPTTGVATRVGSANQFGAGERWPTGLASHNGALYMVGNENDVLFTIETPPPPRVNLLRFGADTADKYYLGADEVDAMYLDGTKVYG